MVLTQHAKCSRGTPQSWDLILVVWIKHRFYITKCSWFHCVSVNNIGNNGIDIVCEMLKVNTVLERIYLGCEEDPFIKGKSGDFKTSYWGDRE